MESWEAGLFRRLARWSRLGPPAVATPDLRLTALFAENGFSLFPPSARLHVSQESPTSTQGRAILDENDDGATPARACG